MSLETPRTPPPSSPNPKAWEKWVGTEGKRLIIFMGYIITLSSSHWWWVLKELRVISILKCFVFPPLFYPPFTHHPSSFPGAFQGELSKDPPDSTWLGAPSECGMYT